MSSQVGLGRFEQESTEPVQETIADVEEPEPATEPEQSEETGILNGEERGRVRHHAEHGRFETMIRSAGISGPSIMHHARETIGETVGAFLEFAKSGDFEEIHGIGPDKAERFEAMVPLVREGYEAADPFEFDDYGPTADEPIEWIAPAEVEALHESGGELVDEREIPDSGLSLSDITDWPSINRERDRPDRRQEEAARIAELESDSQLVADGGIDEPDHYDVRATDGSGDVVAETFEDREEAADYALEMNSIDSDLTYYVERITADELAARHDRIDEALETLGIGEDPDDSDDDVIVADDEGELIADGGTEYPDPKRHPDAYKAHQAAPVEPGDEVLVHMVEGAGFCADEFPIRYEVKRIDSPNNLRPYRNDYLLRVYHPDPPYMVEGIGDTALLTEERRGESWETIDEDPDGPLCEEPGCNALADRRVAFAGSYETHTLCADHVEAHRASGALDVDLPIEEGSQ